jgi:hypothetical protein
MLKNITLSAESDLIEKAREAARSRHTTLNEEFRKWLDQYVRQEDPAAGYGALMERLSYAEPGRSFTRDDLNER